MSTPLLFGRTCAKRAWHQSTILHFYKSQTSRSFSRTATQTHPRPNAFHSARHFFRSPPPPVKGGSLCLAALSPAVFVSLSEKEEADDGLTGEQQMLEASRQELSEQVPGWVGNSTSVRKAIWHFLDSWIIEPIATGFRLLHLIFIFVPVIVTVPVIWLGQRDPERDNERSGTLWWYGFLVNGMERSGAAFIKVIQQTAINTPAHH
jgi:aarF domain-containing kinase